MSGIFQPPRLFSRSFSPPHALFPLCYTLSLARTCRLNSRPPYHLSGRKNEEVGFDPVFIDILEKRKRKEEKKRGPASGKTVSYAMFARPSHSFPVHNSPAAAVTVPERKGVRSSSSSSSLAFSPLPLLLLLLQPGEIECSRSLDSRHCQIDNRARAFFARPPLRAYIQSRALPAPSVALDFG